MTDHINGRCTVAALIEMLKDYPPGATIRLATTRMDSHWWEFHPNYIKTTRLEIAGGDPLVTIQSSWKPEEIPTGY